VWVFWREIATMVYPRRGRPQHAMAIGFHRKTIGEKHKQIKQNIPSMLNPH
jgi:hypothetical protein